MAHDPLSLADMLGDELAQRRESGYDVTAIESRVPEPRDASAAAEDQRSALLDELDELPAPSGWPYEEPTPLADIRAALPEPGAEPGLLAAGGGVDALRDKVLGGWLGRIAGCNLGKPIEAGDYWTPARIRSYLELAGAWPLDDYIPVLDPMPDGFRLVDNWPETTRGRVRGSARDDDIDYTILGLHILETHGPSYSSADVASQWLSRFPFTQVYTAERVAYRNLVHGLRPPHVATYRNPYREWIGAQIRGDIFGYVLPGDPRRAAELAYADAALSHVGNGIYGEMWAAALVSAAFTATGVRELLETSLLHVPPRSRLAEALRLVLDEHAAGTTWEQVRAGIAERYGRYSWVHTVNNAAVVAAGLLYGGGDFTATIALTVQGGLDTDSNGATAGSVAGVLTGAAHLPPHWVDPLEDRVRSALFGFDGVHITELAARTVRLAETYAGPARR